MPLPESLRTQVSGHTQGVLPVHTVRCGAWSDLGVGARAVRLAVFVHEQHIPEPEEWDDDDAHAVHALVTNLAGWPLATGRLITHGQPAGHAKIGRMAVLRDVRGTGLGNMVLLALMAQARLKNIQHISLHAQVSAKAFYARHGFQAEGDEFDEVDIPHQLMSLKL